MYSPRPFRSTPLASLPLRAPFVLLVTLAALTLAALTPASVVNAADEPDDKPAAAVRGIAELRDDGFAALQARDTAAATVAADALLRDHAGQPAAWRLAGDLYLRAGEIKKAIAQFKRYIERVPEHEPDLWQHGIALALDGQYDEGRKLFELHRTVNPNDVENALWHFYCVAKASSPEKARSLVLPAPGDRRVPMEELLKLYRGDADEAVVRAAIDEYPAGSRGHDSASFYGELYLAMYADAVGDRKRAIELAAKAAGAKDVNYMTDVGRIYYSAVRDAAP
jgi:lipoprotein NlpI